jgi:chromosomal replication initiation ATPase DnaA
VALKHGLKYHDIIGTARRRDMMVARREAVLIITTHCRPMSLVQIGRLFHKNHATIINLLRKRKDRRHLDA